MLIIKLFLFLILFSYIIRGVFPFLQYIENVLILCFSLYTFIYVASNQFRSCRVKLCYLKIFLILLAMIFLVIVNSIVNYQSIIYIPSVMYELYKLMTPFYFVPLLLLFKRDNGRYINRLLFLFLSMNAVALILQHIFGVGVVKYFGVFHDLSHYVSRDRPTGLTANANIIGVFGFFCYVYSVSYLELIRNQQFKIVKSLCYLSFLVVILSTSKAAMLCLLLFIFLRKVNFRRLVPVGLFCIFMSFVLFNFNIYGVTDKFQSYLHFIDLLASSSQVKPSLIEGRLWGWYLAIKLFISSPMGYGFGVWGDFSSRINPLLQNFDLYLDYSDSALSHLVVEQGFFCILYFYAISKLLAGFSSRLVFIILLIFLMVTNYGFSQSLFYLGFWMVTVLCFLRSKKVEENINCKQYVSQSI